MFLDASAIVSILTLEEGHADLAARLDAAGDTMTSALAIYESAMAVARRKRIPVDAAAVEVEAFLERAGADVTPIESRTARLALAAQAAFGKASGHPARLNMGDCFAYALPKQHRVPLLYRARTSPGPTSPETAA